MDPILAEFIGTAILLLLGNGVVANVLLTNTKGNGSGWFVICSGFAFAVYVAVLCVGEFSGAHINPAVTVGLAVAGEFPWEDVAGYVGAQFGGAMTGALLVFLFYKPHYDITSDANLKLATFCTAPNIRLLPWNLLCEAVATFVLVYAVLMTTGPQFELGAGTDVQTVKVH